EQTTAKAVLRLIVEIGESGREYSGRVGRAMPVQKRLVFAQHRCDLARWRAVRSRTYERGRRHATHAQLEHRVEQRLSESHAAAKQRKVTTDQILLDRDIQRAIHQYANLDVAADLDPRRMQRNERDLARNPPQARRLPTNPAAGPTCQCGEQLASVVHIRPYEALGLIRMRARLRFERHNEATRVHLPARRAHRVTASTPPLLRPFLASRWSPHPYSQQRFHSRVHPVFPRTTGAACRTSHGRSPSSDRAPPRPRRNQREAVRARAVRACQLATTSSSEPHPPA